MSIARATLTDEQLAAAGAALKSFRGCLNADDLNHTTQISIAAMVAYLCYTMDLDPHAVTTMLANNVRDIHKNPDLLQYVVDKVHTNLQTRVISLPGHAVLRN